MKIIRVLGPAVFMVSLSLAFSVSDSTPPLAGNSGDDPVPTVEVFAARGVLKVHGRNETQYRDMAPGSQSLTSGSFLKTAGGTADILLPDNSVLSLDSGAEVRLGMYTDGTLVAQRSGRVFHHVDWQAGDNYCVDIPCGRARVVGTEFYTITDWPVRGAVNVIVGHVDFDTLVTHFDPRTGAVIDQYWQKNLIPEGEAFAVFPYDISATERLKMGDGYVLSYDQLLYPEPVQGRKTTAPADDAWVRRNRNLGRMIEALRRSRRGMLISDRQYRTKLSALLGIGRDLIPPDSQLRLEGGLYVGMIEGAVINFCVVGNQMDTVRYSGPVYCQDIQTGESYSYTASMNLDAAGAFFIDRQGGIDGGFTYVRDTVYSGLTISIWGRIGSSGGTVYVGIYGESDVARCHGSIMAIDVRRSPAPCVR